ncbi:MAG: hypothetical protein MJ016_03285 [Victivallaceae bacterium]|nr:hypothetical protein [Victivallaceae bacterium]
MTRQEEHFPERSFRRRLSALGAILGIGLLVLFGRAFYLQVGGGDQAQDALIRQSVRRIRIPARRGRILTADKVIVADNAAGFSLLFYPGEMRFPRRQKTIDYMLAAAADFAAAIGRESPLTRDAVSRHLNMRPGLPLTVFSRLDEKETACILEKLRVWRGAEIEPDVSRVYPLGRFACHLIGYTGKDVLSTPDDRDEYFYYVPDVVGRNGIEKIADLRIPGSDGIRGLRGSPGYSLVQVDHLGFVRRHLIEKIDPVDGNHVVLTIDSRAQKIAENVLQDERGAIVVLDAENGDILAAASSPGYDLARFVPKLPSAYYRKLREDPGKPLLHRAFQGSYTPGSILKPLVAIGFLDAGMDLDRMIDCDGFNAVGNAIIRCAAYRRGGHGILHLVDALKYSCNSFMIKEMLEIDRNYVLSVLKRAGIGMPTGVELGESPGVFPTDENKRRRFGTAWNRYDSALLSIGQGIVEVTPLQAALYCAAIANGGTLWQPHLIGSVVDPFGNCIFTRSIVARGTIAEPEKLDVIRTGMYQVVNSGDGSGRRAALDGLEIFGKTGSAEVGVRPHLRINAWFIAFATWENRTYALAIVRENASSGGSSCAPLAQEFFRRYLLNHREAR